MTRPDIESTLQATYRAQLVEGVCAVLIFGSLAMIVALMGRIVHG
jgi:hypothetical protein